jgi:hypothetical protein
MLRQRAENFATLAGNAADRVVRILHGDTVFCLCKPIDLEVRGDGEAKDAQPGSVRHNRRMTQIPASLPVGALLRKGFEEVRTHQTMLWFTVQGRRASIHTWLGHGQRKLHDRLVRLIAKKLHLSMIALPTFVECEMSYREYLDLMVDRDPYGSSVARREAEERQRLTREPGFREVPDAAAKMQYTGVGWRSSGTRGRRCRTLCAGLTAVVACYRTQCVVERTPP